MDAITLWQPWASLVIMRLKPIESRTHARFASLKGCRFAIHAGKQFDFDAAEMICEVTHGNLPAALGATFADGLRRLRSELAWPKSVVLGTAFCLNHRPLGAADSAKALCDCVRTARWGLILRDDIERFDPPIPCSGHQGIWEWERP
ncbi:MAG: hypothetical protein ABSA67_10210 [Candidatus Brocadiia bacterium]|jgi:hypothetical protein